MQKNPAAKFQCWRLADGTCISESIAIAATWNPFIPHQIVFGDGALEIAQIEMAHQQIELELMSQIGASWVNGPIVAKMGLIEPIGAAKQRSDSLTNAFIDGWITSWVSVTTSLVIVTPWLILRLPLRWILPVPWSISSLMRS